MLFLDFSLVSLGYFCYLAGGFFLLVWSYRWPFCLSGVSPGDTKSIFCLFLTYLLFFMSFLSIFGAFLVTVFTYLIFQKVSILFTYLSFLASSVSLFAMCSSQYNNTMSWYHVYNIVSKTNWEQRCSPWRISEHIPCLNIVHLIKTRVSKSTSLTQFRAEAYGCPGPTH